MKNIANYISVNKIIMSIALIITRTFSILLYIVYVDLTILEILICILATFSAIQEGHYIRTRKL